MRFLLPTTSCRFSRTPPRAQVCGCARGRVSVLYLGCALVLPARRLQGEALCAAGSSALSAQSGLFISPQFLEIKALKTLKWFSKLRDGSF